jgi:hypothetical protein
VRRPPWRADHEHLVGHALQLAERDIGPRDVLQHMRGDDGSELLVAEREALDIGLVDVVAPGPGAGPTGAGQVAVDVAPVGLAHDQHPHRGARCAGSHVEQRLASAVRGPASSLGDQFRSGDDIGHVGAEPVHRDGDDHHILGRRMGMIIAQNGWSSNTTAMGTESFFAQPM